MAVLLNYKKYYLRDYFLYTNYCGVLVTLLNLIGLLFEIASKFLQKCLMVFIKLHVQQLYCDLCIVSFTRMDLV